MMCPPSDKNNLIHKIQSVVECCFHFQIGQPVVELPALDLSEGLGDLTPSGASQPHNPTSLY